MFYLTHSPPGACVVRDASGNMSDIITGNNTDGCMGLACKLGWNFTDCLQTQSCQFGLANSVKVTWTGILTQGMTIMTPREVQSHSRQTKSYKNRQGERNVLQPPPPVDRKWRILHKFTWRRWKTWTIPVICLRDYRREEHNTEPLTKQTEN